MDVVDVVLIVLIVFSILHGRRVGAVSQLVSLAGVLVGLAIGAVLVVLVDPRVPNPTTKTIVAIALLAIPASLLGNVGRFAGVAAWRALRRGRLALVDAAAGSVVAVFGTLVVTWLLASILANSPANALNAALARSVIIRGVERVLPPVPDAFASVQRYLSDNDFPVVLANILPEDVGPTTPATEPEVTDAVREVGDSVVKITALGCGDEQEGSGFVAGADLVVTNAHVVAGMTSIRVTAPNGSSSVATPVWFDPDLDLALLRTSPLGEPVLSVSSSYVSRGGPAVVLGYPGGGPFHADSAGVLARFDAVGRNIYDAKLTTRTVYELQAVVRPGNSGGPLVLPTGEVIGVVFSRSSTNPDIGYALSSPAVLAEIRADGARTTPVSTEGCTD